jgi:chitinase
MKAPSFAGVFVTALSAISSVLGGSEAAIKKTSLVSAAYFTGWHATEGFPLSKVSWDKYTHLIYAFSYVFHLPRRLSVNGLFSETNANGTITEDALIPDFVAASQKHVRTHHKTLALG